MVLDIPAEMLEAERHSDGYLPRKSGQVCEENAYLCDYMVKFLTRSLLSINAALSGNQSFKALTSYIIIALLLFSHNCMT